LEEPEVVDEPVAAPHDASSIIAAELHDAGFEDPSEVGRGGCGVIYRCRQAGLDRTVAVKVLATDLVDSRARFEREQQVMAKLTSHPNVVTVLQVGHTSGGHPFLVMPYFRQGCLQTRLQHRGRLSVGETLRVGLKVAGALASAHQLEIVHRDVKPANILFTDYGEPALTDFGIAHISSGFRTARGTFTGSPAFTAPEVIEGEGSSAASDVYGLGATLFCALTGHAAFERRQGEQMVAQFVRIAHEPLPAIVDDDIPADVAKVVQHAMATDPDKRPDAAELGDYLHELCTAHGTVTEDGSTSQSPRPARRIETHRPARGTAGNLPKPIPSFIGRGAELVELRKTMSASRLVTLTGAGGVGKTTLAIHGVQHLDRPVADGVWLVELADLRDPDLVIDVMATTLKVRNQSARPLIEVLVDFLRHRDALIVLDNCEHLIDDVAKLVDTLLRDCPSLKILATSRESLDIGGEAVMPLAPLPCPAADGDLTLSGFASYAAGSLFVQRARAATPGFTLTAENADSVARICRRLDGLPLAIELAAARSRALSAAQIADGLTDRYALLTRGQRGAPQRQQTLTWCVEWSYDLCSVDEQELWAQLSVFAGSFEPSAAHHICGGAMPIDKFLDLLSSLVEKSILSRTEHDGFVRLRMLETLREYGKMRITDADGFQSLRRRHGEWCDRLLADANAQWFGPRQIAWIHRLMVEMPNLREALLFSLTESPVTAMRMTASLRRAWVFHGMLSEARRWADLALDAPAPLDPHQRVRSLCASAWIAIAQGDLPVAEKRLLEARRGLGSSDDPLSAGLIHFLNGFIGMLVGDSARGFSYCHRALATSDDFEVQNSSMITLGFLYETVGDHDQSLLWFERALALAESQRDTVQRSHALASLGMGRWRQGRTEDAKRLLQEGLRLARLADDPWTGTQMLEISAWIAAASGDARGAAMLLAAASALSRAIGAPELPTFGGVGPFHEDSERRAREDLGAIEFEAAWRKGTSLTFEQAIAVALQDNNIDVSIR
jgi:predicted ATPase